MRLVVAALVVALLTSGCGAESGGPTPRLSREKVEQEISRQLAASVGREPESVRCPDDLPGNVDQLMRCTLSDAGTELGVTVTVTSVQGHDVRFSAVVDDTPIAD